MIPGVSADPKRVGGIDPTDMLKVINSSIDGSTMIPPDAWINLPVGYNLGDHVDVSLSVRRWRFQRC